MLKILQLSTDFSYNPQLVVLFEIILSQNESCNIFSLFIKSQSASKVPRDQYLGTLQCLIDKLGDLFTLRCVMPFHDQYHVTIHGDNIKRENMERD